MISRDDLPETPDWVLPRPAEVFEAPAIPANIELGAE